MTADGGNGADGGRQVKISCRNIWKVYGPDCDSFFEHGNGVVADPAALCERMRAEAHVVAASNVTFDVHVGEIFIIMGLSGSGKSTMVRCLSRLVEPTAGEVLLDGNDLLKASDNELIEIRRHKMGMVFQNFGLLPHLTVLENVAFPLKVQGRQRNVRTARALEMIELVGLDGRENAFPRQLSGGQQQRVGIARSLAVEPELWFLDEPFSALDPLIRRQMQDEFLRLADRIIIMKDGGVVQLGTPADLVLRPADDYVAEFTKDVPRVRVITAGEIMDADGDGLDPAHGVVAEMTLEDLMPRMADHPEGLAILDEDGAVIGRVTPQDIVRALAHAEAGESSAAAEAS